MEFRKMVTITLYTRQQKRHWCIQQSLGLCGRRTGWEDLAEWHWNMYNIIYEMSRQSRFDVWYWMLGAGALGWPREMVWGGRREEGSGWGTPVYLWQIHFTYDNIHISMSFSQIIPPSPSPTESKRLFYTSVSLLLSRIQGYCYHLSKFHIHALVYCIGVFLSGLLHSV